MLTNMRDVSSYAAVGDSFPEVEVDYGFPPAKVNMGERLKGKKTIVVGLPGAFTPV
jgi:peroxiredoxin